VRFSIRSLRPLAIFDAPLRDTYLTPRRICGAYLDCMRRIRAEADEARSMGGQRDFYRWVSYQTFVLHLVSLYNHLP
jgi:hypothetical protein